jgi:predicted ATPase
VLSADLLGIVDPEAALPRIDPDARRRRLTALVNAASLARETPALYVVEDAHWIDEVSESMLAEFLTVIPQTPSMVLLTSPHSEAVDCKPRSRFMPMLSSIATRGRASSRRSWQ